MIPGTFNPDLNTAEGLRLAKALHIYEADTPGELHVIHYSANGDETMLTHWYPSAEEISAMIDGKPVALHIVGNRHPWIKLEVPL